MITKHYANLAERQAIIEQYQEQGYRTLHDDFDSDWQEGNEPHGTLTLTNEPSPTDEPQLPLSFEPSNPSHDPPTRIAHIEDFLRSTFP